MPCSAEIWLLAEAAEATRRTKQAQTGSASPALAPTSAPSAKFNSHYYCDVQKTVCWTKQRTSLSFSLFFSS